MMPVTIHKSIEIQAPVERVWNYIGTEDGLRQWWHADIELEGRKGGHCAEYALNQGRPRHLTGEVTVYDPPRQLELTLHDPHDDAWPSLTTISVTLEAVADYTRVSVMHRAYGVAPALSDERPSSSPHQISAGMPKAHLGEPVLQYDLLSHSVPIQYLVPSSGPLPAGTPPHVHSSWQRVHLLYWERALDTLAHTVASHTGADHNDA
jgi:uncharacterized protein YndB with AHSA1/START domain